LHLRVLAQDLPYSSSVLLAAVSRLERVPSAGLDQGDIGRRSVVDRTGNGPDLLFDLRTPCRNNLALKFLFIRKAIVPFV